MTGLQPHHYLARREEIMRAKRAGARKEQALQTRVADST